MHPDFYARKARKARVAVIRVDPVSQENACNESAATSLPLLHLKMRQIKPHIELQLVIVGLDVRA